MLLLINLIIENELSKLSLKNKLRLQLSQELDKLNIPFDENIGVCYNYINSIGTKSLHDVVRATEIEYFLNTQTKYNELCKIYDSNTAKEMAMRNYSETNLIPETIEEYSKIKVCFD